MLIMLSFFRLTWAVSCAARRNSTVAVCMVAIAEGKYATEQGVALLRESVENKRAYASFHGYDFHVNTRKTDNHTRPGAWEKIRLLQRLSPFYDWIVWIDADTIICNTSVRLPDIFLHSLTNKIREPSIIFSRDINGINLGVFAIRGRDKWVFTLLELAWKQRQFIQHVWWEQAAVNWVLYEARLMPHPEEHVGITPQATLNAYANTWKPGDWIVHFAGTRELAKLRAYFDTFGEKCALPHA